MLPTMTADEPTPATGESVPESIDWESVGQYLLQEQLELRQDRLHQAFMTAAGKLRRGEDLEAEDVRQITEAVESCADLGELLVAELEEIVGE